MRGFDLIIFTAVFFIYITLWGRSSHILSSGRSGKKLLRQFSFRIMGIVAIDYRSVYSSLLGLVYLLMAILGIMAGIILYKGVLLQYFSFDYQCLVYILIGILAEVSLVTIITGYLNIAIKRMGLNSVEEVRRVKWINGISLLPKWAIPVMIISSSVLEEIVFRGIFLVALLDQFIVNVWIALFLSTILFVYQQIIQLDTLAQKCIIGATCLVISMMGGFLIIETGSLYPAIIAHASFVVFYTSGMLVFSNRKFVHTDA